MTTILAGSYERFLFGFEVGGEEGKVGDGEEKKRSRMRVARFSLAPST